MISNKIDELISEARSSKDRELLKVLTLIKAELQKAKTAKNRKATGELTEVEEAKTLIAMVEQRKGSIDEYIKGKREDLAQAEQKEIDIIQPYIPEPPTEGELKEYIAGAITAYKTTKEDSYALSMKDMKPLIEIVQGKYPTAPGKLISSTLQGILRG